MNTQELRSLRRRVRVLYPAAVQRSNSSAGSDCLYSSIHVGAIKRSCEFRLLCGHFRFRNGVQDGPVWNVITIYLGFF